MPTVTIQYATSNRVEIPVAEVLRLLQPLLPPERIITGYSYDGGAASFIVHLQETKETMQVPLAEG